MDGEDAVVDVEERLFVPEIEDVEDHREDGERDPEDLGEGMEDIFDEVFDEPGLVLTPFLADHDAAFGNEVGEPTIAEAVRQSMFGRVVLFDRLVPNGFAHEIEVFAVRVAANESFYGAGIAM